MNLTVLASGMYTPVGFSAPAACAAIRASIDGFAETRFRYDGDWLRGAAIPNAGSGRAKSLRMALSVARECLAALEPSGHQDVALVLCTAERERPGRAEWLDEGLLEDLIVQLASPRIGARRALFEHGVLGPVRGLEWAAASIAARACKYCLIVGSDSYLRAPTLDAYHAQRRLLTRRNVDGFLPGEAAAAILVSTAPAHADALQCVGIGWGEEPSARDAELPLRGDGLTAAYKAALAAAAVGFEDIDYRLADVSGEQSAFKETALALARCMRTAKEDMPLWHPSECVGRVGAAAVPLMLGVALDACTQAYAPGPGVLCHAADELGTRAALVLRASGGGALA
jgi:3-oxoacyl-[acyl-carrier-protein] synthase I